MKINNSIFEKSSKDISQCPNNKLPEFALVGRSNVGKSSLINTLLNNKSIAKISSKPGKTLLINHFRINDKFYIVDLPGYGYAKVPGAIKDHWVKTLPRYLQERNSLAGLVIVMDIRRPLTNLDIQMLDWFAPRQKPIHILLTKSDKLSKDKSLRALSDVKKIVQTQWADSFNTKCTVQLFSSLKKQGIEEADKIIQSWLALNKNHIPNLVS